MNELKTPAQSHQPHQASVPPPAPWISVRENQNARNVDEKFTAQVMGLLVLKCAFVSGSGATREEAVWNLKKKLLQCLDFNGHNKFKD